MAAPHEQDLDILLFNLEALKQTQPPAIADLVTSYLDGDYKAVLLSPTAQLLVHRLAASVQLEREQDYVWKDDELETGDEVLQVFIAGLAAFNAFLQTNVTGPVVDFSEVFAGEEWTAKCRTDCLRSLDLGGSSVYQYIPRVELFCLARLVFTSYFPRIVDASGRKDCSWMRIRIYTYHQRLLTGMRGGKLTDSTMLRDLIDAELKELEPRIMGCQSKFSTDVKVQFLLEKAQIYIMEGLELKAEKNVEEASKVSAFSYKLSGALGKRTKFQQDDISQLVVFAKSRDSEKKEAESLARSLDGDALSSNGDDTSKNQPMALDLNDDTLLEKIDFTKTSNEGENSQLPAELVGMLPDEQPQLAPLDQITLLTEATLKDACSPMDHLNSEQIIPFAVRVLADKPTNWQIYTQALLVRSRIESHRSRTMERSVLQLQVIVDQIIADTQQEIPPSADGIPQIQVTSFLPRAKASESAPVAERLKYIFQLNTPTRWEIETELAWAWCDIGSLISALEIFKRLHLWAEVSLCYHTVGQIDKARQVVRRQLFFSSKGEEMDRFDVDASEVATEKWDGEMRSPPPPHAPRLWCNLGDLDNDPACYQRAWEVSNNRYARAQRSLGIYYTSNAKGGTEAEVKSNLVAAQEAYRMAVNAQRFYTDTWNRLGDVSVLLNDLDGAMDAYKKSNGLDDTNAQTHNNLGSVYTEMYEQGLEVMKSASKPVAKSDPESDVDKRNGVVKSSESGRPRQEELLPSALNEFKRAAELSHDNWKLWDNVITTSNRMSPKDFPTMLLAMQYILHLRTPHLGEKAVDIDLLHMLAVEVISSGRHETVASSGIYVPERGSLARALIKVLDFIIPLITVRAELWELVAKVRLYQRDYSGALECEEKAWRVTKQHLQWLESEEDWKVVVKATDFLVSSYENFWGLDRDDREKGWRRKAKSALNTVIKSAEGTWDHSPPVSEGYQAYALLSEKLAEIEEELKAL